MRYLLLLLLSLQLTNTHAGTDSCLATKDCMEHNGKIIDLRNNVQKMIQNTDLIERMEPPQLTVNEFKNLVGKQGPEYFIPIDVNKSDLLLMSGALSLGTVVFANDREIMDFIQANRTETTQEVAHIGNLIGREAILPIAAGSYFLGVVLKNGKLKKVGVFTIGGVLASQIVAEAFKRGFGRKRPNASDSPYDFFEGHKSFFSGHSSAAFAMATAVAEVYKDKPLIPYLAYGAAALTAYARMHDNRHWATDVIVGGIAGHLLAKIMIRTLEGTGKTGRSGLVISPMLEADFGAKVTWTPGYKAPEFECKKSGLVGSELVRLCLDEAFSRSEN